jgi:hypothetical protein
MKELEIAAAMNKTKDGGEDTAAGPNAESKKKK